MSLQKSDFSYHEETVTIKDPHEIDNILSAIGDESARKILTCVSRDSKTIQTIKSECQLTNTTAYRTINRLFNTGLVIDDGIERQEGRYGKKIKKYTSRYKAFNILINGNDVLIDTKIIVSKEKAWFNPNG